MVVARPQNTIYLVGWVGRVQNTDSSDSSDGDDSSDSSDTESSASEAPATPGIVPAPEVEVYPSVRQPLTTEMKQWLTSHEFGAYAQFFEAQGFSTKGHLQFLMNDCPEITDVLNRLVGKNRWSHVLLRNAIDPAYGFVKEKEKKAPQKRPRK